MLELLISIEHRRGEDVVILIHCVWNVVVVNPRDACASLDCQVLRGECKVVDAHLDYFAG